MFLSQKPVYRPLVVLIVAAGSLAFFMEKIQMTKKTQFRAIKTNKCAYLRKADSWSSSDMPKFLYDGQPPKKTFSDKWWEVAAVPQKIEQKVFHSNINHRFVLKEVPGLSNETYGNLKPVMKREECQFQDDDSNWVWNEEYEVFKSLYEPKSDPQPCTWEAIEFEVEIWKDVKDLDNYKPISFPVGKVWNSLRHEHADAYITGHDISHDIIESILNPKEKLANKSSIISSQQMFNIVVEHVKKNIDRSVATITNDYGFHFAVSKVIKPPLHPLESQSWGTKHALRNERNLIIFDFCHAKDTKYGKTVMPAFKGKDRKDLKKKIDVFLKALMDVVNEPLSDCPHCQGRGLVNFRQFDCEKHRDN